ncbi:hypothetical protein [Xanthomonas melonis]|uniref:hypothetical protein n=1 Tax=Xanthomonas melonis TaxID=56456 RepID=UPI0011AFF0FF|nr:hypothetical protein [Xanthomonas melonis]MCC4599765.1 hypothetical protein [Xanthomonas melonis]
MTKFGNARKDAFLQELPRNELASKDDCLTSRCKFNFHYFVPDSPGQDWGDWGVVGLSKLLRKLQMYSERSLSDWENERAGGLRLLTFYNDFPLRSEFKHPQNVPHDVRWGRFRLEQKIRLVGFAVPTEKKGIEHIKTKQRFCTNTFYVVFLDREHKFYITEKA